MNIRRIIVDDEPLAREGMELLVKEAGFLDLRASCSNALEANRALAAEPIDLMFLDIQMPRIRGLDFLKSLTNPPRVIITTAYPNYALEGFELNVLDYLMKPITMERFALEEQLPSTNFLRVQKSFIVSVEKIQSLSGNELTIDRHRIPVSKSYRDDLMKIIDSRLIRK